MAAIELKKRLEEIARIFSERSDLGFGTAADLEEFFIGEFGSLDILEDGKRAGGSRVRARIPRRIYHVLASTLSISAETSLVLGLMLGSELIFKLPGGGLPEFEASVEKLPPAFRARVKLVRAWDGEEMKSCDAVVIFGSDETVDFFRARTGWNQRALFYGHRISFGILEEGLEDLKFWAEKAAGELDAYGQGGCLSPQFYWAGSERVAERFAEHLAEALLRKTAVEAAEAPSFEGASQRRHARRVLKGRGARVWESDEGKGFTVALMKDAAFFVGPGNRFILIGFGKDPVNELQDWKGKVSSISVASSSWPPVGKKGEELAGELGASRLCRMGDLQKPPLSWRHDGRPRLADLATWISWDV